LNDLTVVSGESLAGVRSDIRWAIRSWLEPSTDGVWRRERLTEDQKSAARPLLDRMAREARPVTRPELEAWFLPFMALPNTPLDEDTFMARVNLIGAAVDGYPAACFTAQTRAEGLRRWKWFPTPQEVCELLDPVRASIVEPYDALRQMMDAKPEPRGWQPTSGAREAVDPDHEANRAANAAFLKQFEDAETVRDPVKAKPLHLSDGALLIEYEKLAKQGNEAAAIRVRMLRSKLGMPA